ncbi:coiled-coil domain-containing protein 83 isoform X2 [Strigops habroptila]|uniref:coiled-coil domain-containing protein 83 isoform X2 n=1 Tax=Strigops habroptila TaxID=2489341 RepID=UPI0011CED2FB|nr:coiled-coil domain-containing protein 83 isoform X2 [Strigops habroptila]
MEEKKEEEKPEQHLADPESAFPESLLEFQIETKEAAIDKVLLALKQLEEKNKEYYERYELLKKELQARIRRLLEQIEEEEKERDNKEVVTRDDVEESLIATWQYVKDKEQLLEDLHSQIEETNQKISVKQSEKDYCLEYKNVGSKIEAKKIMSLEKDIKEVKDVFRRATEYYRNALKAMKEENVRLVLKHMDLVKEQAPETAVRYLDKDSCREIEENGWLKEEVKLYRKEVSDLKASIQLLEEENIALVAKLVDNRLEYLGVPRHLAAGLPDEFLKDEMKAVEYSEYAAEADGDESLRSATEPCQKTKAFPKTQSTSDSEEPHESDEEIPEQSLTPTLGSLSYGDEKDLQEHLELSPLETKLMCVIGKAMPIHKQAEEMPSRRDTEDGMGHKSDRHITARMIRALSNEKVG